MSPLYRRSVLTTFMAVLLVVGGVLPSAPIPLLSPLKADAAAKWTRYNRFWKYYVHSGGRVTVWAYDDGRIYGVGSVRSGRSTHFWGFDRTTGKNVVRDPGEWGFPGRVRGT